MNSGKFLTSILAWLKINWYVLLGGLIFLAIFSLGYAKLNSELYAVRDDGVITMSHARNLIDYGFIGVNPSGERVEGYSAPVQFFVYAISYWLSGVNYFEYAWIQTLVCTALLGAIFAGLFQDNKKIGVAATILTALLLTKLTSFFQWHGSGMENAITHVLFIALLYGLYSCAKSGEIDMRWVVVPVLASLSRIDGMYHVFPVLLIFSIYWLKFQKSKRGFAFMIAVLSVWLMYQLWRYLYFGDLKPNTAYAQDISLSQRLIGVLRLDKGQLKESAATAGKIFSAQGGYFLLAALPFLPFMRRDKNYGLLMVMALSLIATAWFNPFLFGPTRLDITRSTTQMALFVFVVLGSVACLMARRRYALLTIALVFVPVGMLAARINSVASYDMCCQVGGFEATRKSFAEIAAQENIFRPMVANPDLGAMSWHKQFNVLDIGMLGSTMISRLRNGPLLSQFFFDYAAPDMLESHTDWSCRYQNSIFSDPRFARMYRPINVVRDGGFDCANGVVTNGTWIRRDIERDSGSAERRLMDDLRSGGVSVERVARELQNCQRQQPSTTACTYVARSVYRFLPEFRAAGKIPELLDAFSISRTRPVDTFMISGYADGKSNLAAIEFIADDLVHGQDMVPLPGGNGFDIYHGNRALVFVNNDCSKRSTLDKFFLHAFPKDKGDFPAAEFLSLDFDFDTAGVRVGARCFAAVALPNWTIGSIKMGQWRPKDRVAVWERIFTQDSAI